MEYHSDRRLAELAAFAAVIEHRGFSAAARVGGLRKATLSERVRSLEERLGVALLVRTTRSLHLTDEGRAYAEHARRALAAARQAEASALASRDVPTGTLRMSTTPVLATLLVEKVVAPYMRKYPSVSVEMDASPRVVDLAREGFDVVVRVGRLADSSLMVRRLGRGRGGYYASPAYLERRGVPNRPEDLAEHDAIGMSRGDRLPEWHFASGARKRSVVVRPRMVVASYELGIRAATSGLGVVPCLREGVRALLAKRALVPVLEAWTPPAYEVSALFTPTSALVPKTRVMVDMLVAWFQKHGGVV